MAADDRADVLYSNGFKKFPINRYYVPLSGKGSIAIKLGLHQDAKDALPEWAKNVAIPAFNWISGAKVKIMMRGKIPKEEAESANP
jgi:hypothetical protein